MKKSIYLLFFIVSMTFLSCGDDPTAETLEEREFRLESEVYLKYYDVQDASSPRVVEDGVLFTFADNYSYVEVSGDFNNWENAIPLIKSSYGVYYFIWQEPLEVGTYLYRYRVNDVWMNDPLNDQVVYDDFNQMVSYFEILEDASTVYNPNTFKNPIYNDDGTVTFLYSDDLADEVMFTSDHLGFNTTRYSMTKDSSNVWSITLDSPNGNYYYNFIIDREWEVDPLNANVVQSDNGILHSYVFINKPIEN